MVHMAAIALAFLILATLQGWSGVFALAAGYTVLVAFAWALAVADEWLERRVDEELRDR